MYVYIPLTTLPFAMPLWTTKPPSPTTSAHGFPTPLLSPSTIPISPIPNSATFSVPPTTTATANHFSSSTPNSPLHHHKHDAIAHLTLKLNKWSPHLSCLDTLRILRLLKINLASNTPPSILNALLRAPPLVGIVFLQAGRVHGYTCIYA